jgi:branched-chain amino acid transport system permease protein
MEMIYWLYRILKEEILDVPGRVIATVFVIGLLIVPLISTNNYLLRILTLAAIFTIFAVSWDLLSGVVGQMNFGQGAFFGIAGYASGLLNIHLSLPPYLSIPIGSLVGVFMGLLIGLPALRLRGFYLALVTLAFPVILTGIIFLMPSITGGELGIYGLKRISESQISIYYIVYFTMLVSVYIMYKLTDVESKMVRSGVIFNAIREDEITARASGINTTQYKLMAFAVSGFFAGIAGGLYSHYMRAIGPSTLELMFSLNPVLWTIFGGLSTIYGAVAGVYILYPLIEFLGMNDIGANVRYLILAVILIFTLLFMPEGITVWIRDKLEITCQRCKVNNSSWRRECRACNAELHMKKEKSY